MPTPITALPVTLPASYCLGPLQEFVNLIIGGSSFSLAGTFTSYVIGAGVPAVTDHDKLWYRTTDGRIYFWDGNSWIAPYWNDPMVTLGASQFLPGKDAAWLLTVDHDGSTAIPGSLDRSGPFWEEDVLMRGRFPLGYGTLQPSGTVIPASGAGSAGGTDQTTLTGEQGGVAADHVHPFGWDNNTPNDDVSLMKSGNLVIPNSQMLFVAGDSAAATQTLINSTVANLVSGKPFVNGQPIANLTPVALMNPYQAGVYAKRTARKYFSVT